MARYKATIEYDGTNYKGWQSQPKGDTVQDAIENALKEIFGKKITVFGSGRTDTGVHALGQVAHFDAETVMTEGKLLRAVNAHLPEDVRIKKLEKADENFHARFDAKRKTYLYKLYLSDVISPLRRNYAHQVYGKVDVNKMKEATDYFVGTHDFYAFSSKSDKEDTVRTLDYVNLTQNGDEVDILMCGDGFLYNMVRVIVATIVEVGKCKIPVADIPKIFEGKDRSKSGKKLSPEGLYLVSVEY